MRTFERLQDDFKEIKKSILTFMDWVLTLPESLEIRYNEEIQQFEEEHGVTYITSFERIGIQKGMQQGIHRRMRNTASFTAAQVSSGTTTLFSYACLKQIPKLYLDGVKRCWKPKA